MCVGCRRRRASQRARVPRGPTSRSPNSQRRLVAVGRRPRATPGRGWSRRLRGVTGWCCTKSPTKQFQRRPPPRETALALRRGRSEPPARPRLIARRGSSRSTRRSSRAPSGSSVDRSSHFCRTLSRQWASHQHDRGSSHAAARLVQHAASVAHLLVLVLRRVQMKDNYNGCLTNSLLQCLDTGAWVIERLQGGDWRGGGTEGRAFRPRRPVSFKSSTTAYRVGQKRGHPTTPYVCSYTTL